MNSETVNITLSIPLERFAQIKSITKLMKMLDGKPLTENQVAEKLLLHSLSGFTPMMQSEDYSENAFTANQTGEKTERTKSVIVTDQSDSALPIKDLLENQTNRQNTGETIGGLSDEWQGIFEKVPQGARIGIVSNEADKTTRWMLGLASEFTKAMPVLYIAPDLIGDISELFNEYGINEPSTIYRKKTIHFLPETKTEWKQLLLSNRGNLLYKAVFFDSASNLPTESGILETVLGTALPVTEVYALTFDFDRQHETEFQDWIKALDVVLRTDGKAVSVIKNSFREQVNENPGLTQTEQNETT